MSENTPKPVNVTALLFDKDGTLFDFHSTWSHWTATLISELAGGDAASEAALCDVLHFDMQAKQFHPTSPAIAGTNREMAECVVTALPHRDVDETEHYIMINSSQAPLVPAVPLAPFLDELIARELGLGVMTNDTEYGARAHLESAGIAEKFHFIAGFDSGYGAKPAPDPLLAFASAINVAPSQVAMVGDSAHDLIAGRAAGMQTIGVLTGVATADDLAPLADVVLPDIGHIPDWLSR